MKNNNNNEDKNKKIFKLVILCAIALLIGAIAWFVTYTLTHSHNKDDYTYAEFQSDFSAGEIEEITIEQNSDIPTGTLIAKYSDGTERKLNIENVADIAKELRENDIRYVLTEVKQESLLVSMLPTIVIFIIFLIAFYFIFGKISGGNYAKGDARVAPENLKSVTFANVAGLQEEKAELEEIVTFLKTPQKYTTLGAKIPKGILLVGPPGTGKTLLARAVAGEAGVPFYQISGSEFEEVFVGVGASRVRKLFGDAKKNSPCIIFIDEIDAVARKRSKNASGRDETAQTLNQILVEMDGFSTNEGIIVMAATNRADVLDSAILRPGRFDRKVFVGRPDVGGRQEILEIYAKDKPIGDDVSLKTVAETTVGFSGADLENLMNEAAICAANRGAAFISQSDIDKSFIKVGIGTEKKSRVVSEKEKRITAYHESGHALLFHLIPDIGPVHMVSIIPTGDAGGYTLPVPENDVSLGSKTQLLGEITALFGGITAEELIFSDITTGASQDIKQATSLARQMVIKYGMSSLGAINLELDEMSAPYSEKMNSKIDDEVSSILSECRARAKKLLEENKDKLSRCAEELLIKEKITKDEFEKIIEN